MAVGNRQTIFRYKTRKGLLHKVPAVIKLLLLLPLSIVCMSLPIPYLALGVGVAILIALICGLTPAEQACDLVPAIFYSALLYALSIFSTVFENFANVPLNTLLLPDLLIRALIPKQELLHAALRLTLIIQLSALIFRTTSSIEIRGAISGIECFFRQPLSHIPRLGKFISRKPRFAEGIALFAGFIPEIFETWGSLDRAWRARGGKGGLRKITVLVFALISLSLEKAARKSTALQARSS